MITEQVQIKGQQFRRKVKAELAMRDDTITALGKRIEYRANTVTAALKEPWKFPRVIAAIKADLFPVKGRSKREVAA